MKKLFLGALLALAFVFPALANFSAPTATMYTFTFNGKYYGPQPTKQGAIDQQAAFWGPLYGGTCAASNWLSDVDFTFGCTNANGQTVTSGYAYLGVSTGAACPANSTSVGSGQCSCNSGFTEQGATCQSTAALAQQIADALNAANMPIWGNGAPPVDLSSCYAGFKVKGRTAVGVNSGGVKFALYGPFTATGETCTGSSSPGGSVTASTEPTPSTCSGQYGNLNGQNVCIPYLPKDYNVGSTGSSKTTSSTTGATTTGNTTETTTSCDGVNCTTTTTETPTGGGTPTVTQSTQDQSSFCSANPTSGLCGAEKPKTDCEKFPSSVGCSEFGSPDSPTLTHENSSFSSIASVVFGSASGCPTDLAFSVFGHSYAISYASMCSSAQTYVAPVVLVLSLFAAAFIFSGGFRL